MPLFGVTNVGVSVVFSLLYLSKLLMTYMFEVMFDGKIRFIFREDSAGIYFLWRLVWYRIM
jgi:hypothetical protein